MNDENETASASEPASGDPQPEVEAKGPPQPQWEYRKNFKITEKMTHIVKLTVDVAKAEQARLRRQIEKLTYGS